MGKFTVLTGPFGGASTSHGSGSSGSSGSSGGGGGGPKFNVSNWHVVSIVGEEAINELFDFRIELAVLQSELTPTGGGDSSDTAIEAALLGNQVQFSMGDTGLPRYGIIASVEMLGTFTGTDGHPMQRFRVRIRPTAWILTQRRDTRIFQALYVHEIIQQVCKGLNVSCRWSLTRQQGYPIRIYCTQYHETDWELITRLMAEEGILFYFEHDTSFKGDTAPSANVVDPSVGDYIQTALKTASSSFGAFGQAAGLAAGIMGLTNPQTPGPDDDQVFKPGSSAPSPGHLPLTFNSFASWTAPPATISIAKSGASPAKQLSLAGGIEEIGASMAQVAAASGGSKTSGATDVLVFVDAGDAAVDPLAAHAARIAGYGTSQHDSDADEIDGVNMPAMPSGGGGSAAGSILTCVLQDESGMNTDSNSIGAFAPVSNVRAVQVELKDYDFRRPMQKFDATFPTATASIAKGGPSVYDPHGEYEKPEIDADGNQAKIQLEAYRSKAFFARGRGICPRLVTGFSFQLNDPNGGLGGEYVPTRILHEEYDGAFTATTAGANRSSAALAHLSAINANLATAAGSAIDQAVESVVAGVARGIHELETNATLTGSRLHAEDEIRAAIEAGRLRSLARTYYQNRFECVPATVAFRPGRPRPKPYAVSELAMVTGPAGSEINVDQYGRVQVLFKFDRLQKPGGAGTSCWMRVVQPWAGTGYGFQFFPRVGMEVLVTFIGGDPDRPIVIGSLYNATHPTPEPLPNAGKGTPGLPNRNTRSGIRTQTSPGGGGFNELSFEDAKGTERIYVRAEKDFHLQVNDAQLNTIDGRLLTRVGDQRQTSIAKDSLQMVAGAEVGIVAKSQSNFVAGDQVARIERNRTQFVEGDEITSVQGSSLRDVRGDDIVTVEGDRNLAVHGNTFLHVGLADGTGADAATANAITHVVGKAFLSATDGIVVRASTPPQLDDSFSLKDGGKWKADEKTKLRLEVGDTFIEMTKDTIKLSAKHFIFQTDDDGDIVVNTKTLTTTATDKATITGKDTVMAFDSDGLKVSGGKSITLQETSGSQVQLKQGKSLVEGPSGATMHGATVALASGGGGGGGGGSNNNQQNNNDAQPNLQLQFSFGNKQPIALAKVPFRLVGDAPDDTTGEPLVLEGKTNDQGEIKAIVPTTTKTVLVTLQTNKSDHAFIKKLFPKPLEYTVEVLQPPTGGGDAPDDSAAFDYSPPTQAKNSPPPAAADVKKAFSAARVLLQNLGIPTGHDHTIGDAKKDPATSSAVEEFQRQAGRPPNGSVFDPPDGGS